MAETRDRLRRTLALLPTLVCMYASGETTSLSALAAQIGTTPATLADDLDAMTALELPTEQVPEYFDFDLSGNSLRVNAVPLVLTDSARTVRLTEPEAASLLAFIDEVANAVDDEADEALDELADTIAAAAGIPASLTSWSSAGPVPDKDVLTTMLAAAAQHLSCQITYMGRQAAPYRTLVDPYHLRLERGFWYAIVRQTDGASAGQERVYRLDKIAHAELADAYVPDPIDLDAYTDGVFRPNRPPSIARVRFDDEIASWAQERWGEGRECDDGTREFDIEYHDEDWLIRTLSLFGTAFEVTEPQELRDAIVARCEDTGAERARHRAG